MRVTIARDNIGAVDGYVSVPPEQVRVRSIAPRPSREPLYWWRATRLTLFAEVLNVYARENVRAARPGINGITHQVFRIFDSMFPLIPSAGLSLEF